MARKILGVSLVLALALVAAVGTLAGTSSTEGLTGLWLTQDGDAHVRIETCDDGLCGRIVWMDDPLDRTGAERRDVENPDPGLRERRVQGMTILRIADNPDDKGVLRGGRIYDPKSGRTYRCTLRLDGENVLKMRGYLGIPLLGRTTRWTRVARGWRSGLQGRSHAAMPARLPRPSRSAGRT